MSLITIYEKDESDFNTLGLGTLLPSECTIKEELNGLFELELTHYYDDLGKYKLIEKERIISASTPNGRQPFRIYKLTPTLDNIKVNARHIFYDLLDNFILSYSNTSEATSILSGLVQSFSYNTNFRLSTNINKLANIIIDKENPVSALLGNDEEKPKFIQSFGGEILRDNYNIQILDNIGSDRGVTVRYGKNIVGMTVDEDYSSIITRLYPIGKNGLTLPEKFIDSPNINNYIHPKIGYQEFSDAENIQALKLLAAEFLKTADTPLININIDFILLSSTVEYKNFEFLEVVRLGDILTIYNEKMNFSKKAKVISYSFNAITDSYNNIVLGDFLNILTNSITQTNSSVKSLKSSTETFNNKVKIVNGTLYILDNDNLESARTVYKFDSTGISKSTTGVNGTFTNILN